VQATVYLICDLTQRHFGRKGYDINLKAELEIELLHRKIDLLREQEIGRLNEIIQRLAEQLRATQAALPTRMQ
jgi:uncharacterized membrane protein